MGVAGGENKIGNWLCAQFCFKSLRFRRAEIQRLELAVESNQVRQVVVKISGPNRDSVFPEPLFDADVPAEIFFRPQSKVHPKNFVLTARRTESGRDTR